MKLRLRFTEYKISDNGIRADPGKANAVTNLSLTTISDFEST